MSTASGRVAMVLEACERGLPLFIVTAGHDHGVRSNSVFHFNVIEVPDPDTGDVIDQVHDIGEVFQLWPACTVVRITSSLDRRFPQVGSNVRIVTLDPRRNDAAG